MMANSAAAALLSLQSEGSRVQGLKRRVLLAEDDVDTARVRSRSSKTVAAADSSPATVVEEELCASDVLPEDVLAQCLSHLDSFQDMAS